MTDFKMEYVSGKCPVCNTNGWLRKISGKNVGELNIKCINCNSYFKENEIKAIIDIDNNDIISFLTNFYNVNKSTAEAMVQILDIYIDNLNKVNDE